MSEIQYSCIFQEAMNRGKYAYVGLWVRCALGKKILRLKNPTSAAKKTENNRFRVPIHFATNRFTFKTILPPLQLLHPTTCLCTHTSISNSRFPPRFEV